MMVKC